MSRKRKTSIRRYAWSIEEDNLMRNLYSIRGPVAMIPRLYKKSGIQRTRDSVRSRAKTLGIICFQSDGLISCSELHRIYHLSKAKVKTHVLNGNITPIGTDHCWFFSIDDVDWLIAHYKVDRNYDNWLTVASVSKSLGYSKSTIYRLVKSGAIDGVLVGHDWIVNPKDVDSLAEKMRKDCAVKIDSAKYFPDKADAFKKLSQNRKDVKTA